MIIETTNQLALHQARQDQFVNSRSYTESFLSSLDKVKDYDYRDCPTCGHKADDPIFIKNQGAYCYCPSCRHIYLSNQLSSEKLLAFYSGYPTSTLEWHLNETEFYRRIYLKGLSSIQSISAGSKILDIGCSSGLFLSVAIDNGFDGFGVEPNESEAEYARLNGIKVIGSTVTELDKSSFFDVITLWDVLEHIKDPVGYVKSLKSILRPGGHVFVQVPTSDSLAARILRSSCNMFDGVEHLTLFSKHSLDLAFTSAGYALVSFQTIISETYAINNYLSYANDAYLDNSADPLVGSILDSAKIESEGLGYKIQAIYRKEK